MLTFGQERMPDPLDLWQTLLVGYNELTTGSSLTCRVIEKALQWKDTDTLE